MSTIVPSIVRRAGAAALLLAGLWGGAARAEDAPVTVFAAASLKGSLDAAANACKAESGAGSVISYAASSALMKQIEQGAPADLFASADLEWMDYGEKHGLIRGQTRANLLGNELVLVAPADSTATVSLAPGGDLAAAVGDGKIATGDVKSVPVGKYAKAALTKLGMWTAVEPKLAMADNVRAALALVARGEAKFGIVYSTDARAEPKVKVVATFPEDSHPPIVYPFAVTTESKNAAAAALLSCLKGKAAGEIFSKAGFTLLK